MIEFDSFWQAYPRKVGKGDARKAFKTAIKLTDLETMLAAIERYKRYKPEWQHFCHPGTWLRQERWDDEWPEPAQQTGGAPRSFDYQPKGKVVNFPSKKTAFHEWYEKQKAEGDG